MQTYQVGLVERMGALRAVGGGALGSQTAGLAILRHGGRAVVQRNLNRAEVRVLRGDLGGQIRREVVEGEVDGRLRAPEEEVPLALGRTGAVLWRVIILLPLGVEVLINALVVFLVVLGEWADTFTRIVHGARGKRKDG